MDTSSLPPRSCSGSLSKRTTRGVADSICMITVER